MSAFTQIQELATAISEIVALTAPTDWARTSVYGEFLYVDGYLDQVTITDCVSAKGERIDLALPFQAVMLLRSAFESQESHNERWTAIKITTEATGRYSSALYYGAPPHLSGDPGGASERIDASDD